MAMNEIKFIRLRKAIEWSNRQLEFPRDKRIEAVKQYCGSHYAEGGPQRRVPINMLKLAVDIYVRQLAARAPRALICTAVEDLKPTAANLQIAVNMIPDEIGLSDTLRRFVTEALFSIGVLKVGLHSVGEVLNHRYGEPFVDNVTLDDYFCDMSAKRLDMIQFEGNDYWVEHEELMESGWGIKSAKSGLMPDEYTTTGQAGEDRAEAISSDETAEVYKKRNLLRDVWIPSEGIIVTYGVKSEKILNEVEWTGPAWGPYHKLGFSEVPGNLLPLSPVSVWRDLHELENALFRKLSNQADAQKTVQGFSGGNDESVEDFQKARDGDGIRYSGPKPEKLTAGGVDPTTLAFFMQCRDLSSYFGGNLDSLGGLSAMTQTVGQDKLLGEAAGAQLRDMAARTIDAIRGVFRSLAFYEWHNPVKRRTLEKRVPGTDMAISVDWGRDAKIGDFDMYSLDIDVYSMQDDSPSLRLQKLGAVVQNYILPLAPMIQQASGMIDVQYILEKVAEYSDMEEVSRMVTFSEPTTDPAAPETATAANTTHTSERIGRPGPTRQGASDMMQQLLMGGNAGGNTPNS